MRDSLDHLQFLLREVPHRRLFLLFFLMLAVGLSEGIGILTLVPILGLLQGGAPGVNPVAQALMAAMEALRLPPTLGGLLLAFLALMLIRSGMQFSRDILASDIQHRLVDGLRERCFDRLLHMEWRWHLSRRRSDHASLLITDINRVGAGLHFGIGLLASLVVLLCFLAATLLLSWRLSLLALVSAGLILLAMSGQRRGAHHLGVQLSEANRAMQSDVQESVGSLKLAKILRAEERYGLRFRQTLRGLRHQQMAFQISTRLAQLLLQAGGAALLAGYLYVGVQIMATPLPELFTLILLFSRLIPLFAASQQQLHQWLHALPAMEETRKFLNEWEAWGEPRDTSPAGDWKICDGVNLAEATLTYPDRSRPALDQLNLAFPANSFTAIVGVSGAGKSSVADILIGLLTPDRGQLLVDGVAIDAQVRQSWRRAVAYVPQEAFLFHDSIRNNLQWARPDADEAAMRLALETAAADFVFRLPEGLDTIVGDGGARLSGGERQRIALARALLLQPALLILDEATSALDQANEGKISQALNNLRGRLTLILIGHRGVTLEQADQVFLLDHGRLVVCGDWRDVRRHPLLNT